MSAVEDVSHCSEFILSDHNLPKLLGIVGRAAAKWRQIGVSLKFSKDVLDTIAATSGNSSPIDCFIDLLSRWLKWTPPNHDLPTVKTLAEALRAGTVGEERMANELVQGFERKI